MTAQQMFPEEQQPLETDEIYHFQQPYYKSGASGMPKEEPAASYEGPLYQQNYQSGYQAQEQQQEPESRYTHTYSTSNERQQFRSRQQWDVPVWARPQIHRRSWKRIVLFIILGVLLFKPLLILLGVLLTMIGLAIILPIAMVLLALMIPFLLVFVVALPYLLFSLLMGRPLSRRGWYPRYRPRPWRYTRTWHYGPWW